jgi:hypothetical protein
VLLHVYVTGHGYMDEEKRSLILLNQRIHFNPVEKNPEFMNPYPLESVLDKIFTTFHNVCIVLIADICREKLEFKKMLFGKILNEKNSFDEKKR